MLTRANVIVVGLFSLSLGTLGTALAQTAAVARGSIGATWIR